MADMESESRMACDSCAANDEISDAETLCFDCKKYLCRRCTRSHSVFDATKMHTVVGLEDVENRKKSHFELGKDGLCQVHNNKSIEYFCQDHSVLCCTDCLFITHRKCDDVTRVIELGQSLKEENKTQQLDAKMEKVQTTLEEITEKLEENAEYIGKQSKAIKIQAEECRASVVQKIDQIVHHINSKCDELAKKHGTNLSEKIASQKNLTATISSSRSLLKSAIDHGSNAQVFIVFHKVEELYTQYKARVSTEKSNSATVKLQVKFDKAVDDFINTPEEQSKIEVTNLPVETSIDGQQLLVDDLAKSTVLTSDEVLEGDCCSKSVPGGGRGNKPQKHAERQIESLALVELKVKESHKTPHIRGIGFLANGQLVLIDNRNKLCNLLDDAYKVTTDLSLPGLPLGLTVINDSKIMIAVWDNRLLQVALTGNTLTLTTTISCNRQLWCIAHISDTELAVGWWGAGIGIISLEDGKEKMYLDKDTAGREIKIELYDYITVDVYRSRFYQTSDRQSAMYCFGFNGNPVYTYKNDKFGQPSGIALDGDGYAYICSWKTNNIHQISPDGILMRTVDVGLSRPYIICFNTTGDRIAVVNYIYNESRQLSIMKVIPAL